MRALFIIGIILAAFALFCLLPLGVTVIFGKPVVAKVWIGPIRFQVAPSRKKKKKTDEKEEKPEKENKQVERGKKIFEKLKESPKSTLEMLSSVYQTLMPPTKKALRRLLHGIKIDPLQIGITLGGSGDPAKTAELYGRAEGVIWAVMPALEQLVRIPHPGIHLGVDFDTDKTNVQGEVGVSVRIGTLLVIGLGIGIPALRWFLKYHRRQKKKKNEQTAEVNSPAERPAA